MHDEAYAVLITSLNPEWKIRAIKRVREITGVGIADAKAIVDTLPVVILDGLFQAQASELSGLLNSAGMETEIRADPANRPQHKQLLQMTFESSDATAFLRGDEAIVIPVEGGGSISISVDKPSWLSRIKALLSKL